MGDVVTDEMGATRGLHYDNDMGRSYLFDLDFFSDHEPGDEPAPALALDGSRRGSVCRFINHSCEPNLRIEAILDERNSEQLYRIGLFASVFIPALTELSYNYGYKPGCIAGLNIPCRCGTPSCNKRLI